MERWVDGGTEVDYGKMERQIIENIQQRELKFSKAVSLTQDKQWWMTFVPISHTNGTAKASWVMCLILFNADAGSIVHGHF